MRINLTPIEVAAAQTIFAKLTETELEKRSNTSRIAKTEKSLNTDSESFLTENEASKLLKVSRVTLYKKRKEGKLPYLMIGSCIRYKKADLLKFIEA